MADAYQQAIESKNADQIKHARTAYKSKLTRAITAFKASLIVKKIGDVTVFDHEKIEHA